MEKVGKLEFPDALLKRIMRLNNQDKDEKFVEDNYDKSIDCLLYTSQFAAICKGTI